LLIAAAEIAQRNGDLETAIRHWQRLAAVEGAQMEQAYYDRLAQAYKQIKSFPLASAEDEALHGDTDKHQVLKRIHEVLQPGNYLEIGVQTGRSLFLAACPAIGVDPAPMLVAPPPERVQLVRATSDLFFAEQASNVIQKPIDLAFIDGMHLFEYALRDFINIERYAGPHTLVVIDDILPGSPAQAARDRRTRAWTGDVWKLLVVLRQHRPDLSLVLLNAYPTGLLCITGLHAENTILHEAYEDITTEWSINVPLPDEILSRAGSLSCTHPDFEAFLERLRDNRSVHGS
jgi:predicted O-methyltransferase YrrM